MSLVSTDPHSVRSLLKIGLAAIACMAGERIDFDRVMSLLSAGSARLFIDEEQSGFVILRASADFMTGTAILFVLAAYKHGGDGMADYDAEIEEIARSIGAQKVVFRTKRPGLVRKANSYGYVADGTYMMKGL